MATSSPPPRPASALTGKEGVCLLEVSFVEWVWEQPWQRCKQQKCTGSGFCIDGNRILTNAHVVASAIDIRVRLHGSTRRFPAKVVTYGPDVDLAILRIDGDEAEQTKFFGNGSLAVEFASELPALQERVSVIGFPSGGKTVCVTEGVVSRIDDLLLASAGDTMLVIQIDAAVNPGSSGGPAFNSKGQVTGVAFCKSVNSSDDNIGYVIPAAVVRAFLGRCDPTDGSYTLSPSVPYLWHSLENDSLRLAYDVPEDVHGILLTNVAPTVQDALQKGDVLTKIDNSPIADDGQVTLREDELIQHGYLLRGKHLDEETVFTVFRNGKHVVSKPCVLRDIPTIFPRWPDVDHQPDYLILGALVLLPMSCSLMGSKKAGTRLLGTYHTWSRRWPGDWDDKKELVVLSNIFAHSLSHSYSRAWRRVKAYNGIPVKSLSHLRDLWAASCEQVQKAEEEEEDDSSAAKKKKPSFCRIELEHDDEIVFEIKAALAAQSEILEVHQIPKACVIHPRPNPKYRLHL